MGRGQYDRATVKRPAYPVPEYDDQGQPITAIDYHTMRTTIAELRAALAAKAEAPPPPEETAGDVLAIVQLRAEVAKRDDLIARYAALIKRHGLWLDE